MARYAIVVIVEAPQAEAAWERVGERLFNRDMASDSVVYVGAPWVVPHLIGNEYVEYGTEAIRLRLNDERVDLDPDD
jgi:hypothetical protein